MRAATWLNNNLTCFQLSRLFIMTEHKSKIEEIISQINSRNCKKVAFFLVISFACYHAILHLKYGKHCDNRTPKNDYRSFNASFLGTNSCKWLLSDGRYKGDQEWQPYGCMLHFYTKVYGYLTSILSNIQ